VKAVDDLLALVACGRRHFAAPGRGRTAAYFTNQLKRGLSVSELASVQSTFLRAYRYQYIGSGIEQTRLRRSCFGLVGDSESTRIKGRTGTSAVMTLSFADSRWLRQLDAAAASRHGGRPPLAADSHAAGSHQRLPSGSPSRAGLVPTRDARRI